MATHNIFISHSWDYTDSYEKLVGLLNNAPRFEYKNFSVPRDDPIHNAPNEKALREAIRRQIQSAQVILVLAGVYSSYRKWIREEIDLALDGFARPKPIIAIEPFASGRTSAFVKENADRIVKWNGRSVVTAIRELAR